MDSSSPKLAGRVLAAISLCHLLNDMVQSLISAVYPVLRDSYRLDYTQLGLISLTFALTASILQPVVGFVTDRHPQPYSLTAGMTSTLTGVLVLAFAPGYAWLLLGAGLVGLGSAIFHPESSRVARLASGGQHGLAQSVFQVGGNFGTAAGPLAAVFVSTRGQRSLALFSIAALAAIALLVRVCAWYRPRAKPRSAVIDAGAPRPRRRHVAGVIFLLGLLIFCKYFYQASLGSYYIFYLIERFHVSVEQAQLYLFLFLGAIAVGTIAGGPIGDRYGRRFVIRGSMLGIIPFALWLPHASLTGTAILTVIIGLILASAFSAILVYAQDLVPGRVGLISGLFFGFAFGMGGLGAALLGKLADLTSIGYVYQIAAYFPLLGLLALALPPARRPAAS